MIIYATTETRKRLGLPLPEEIKDPSLQQKAMNIYQRKKGDRLLEWGAKLFYFDRRKCIQFCNYASKFTVILVDVKKADVDKLWYKMGFYLLDLYMEDEEMVHLVERYINENSSWCYGKITDRRILSNMNYLQLAYLEDGYRLYDYLDNGILRTREVNKFINTQYIMCDHEGGKRDAYVPVERFAELLKAYYAKPK